MRFTSTPLAGVFVADLDRREDERGFFARLWCCQEMRDHGLNGDLAQCSISFNRRRGTIRGMHWQAAPAEEDKLVCCLQGAIYDVALDLRQGSDTYARWFAVELTGESRRMLYVPRGFAHGFQTLRDDSEVLYMISVPYRPELARGVRWDDPAFGIAWPLPVGEVSERDRNHPLVGEPSRK